jgi:hypothetical protein
MVKGVEPYTRLLDSIREVTVHKDAVKEFPYDWRLPVAHNAAVLAEAAQRHLEAWRRHPAQIAAQRRDPNASEAQLVIVAHSMGGLLARGMMLIPGARDIVRATVTLGTPFYGAVKAAVILNSGRGAPVPLPHSRLRDLAVNLPGIYDLLPVYRCVDLQTEARRLTPADIADLGGNQELAKEAARAYRQVADVVLPGHVQVVGAHQPTLQSLTLADGIATGHTYTCRPESNGIKRVDQAGDGTVARDSAQVGLASVTPLAQSHGALAKTNESVLVVTDLLTHQLTGPWLGATELGLSVPDLVAASSSFDIIVSGIDHPRDASCRIIDVATERQISAPQLAFADGRIIARANTDAPGLCRVEIIGGGTSPVSQLVLVSEGPMSVQDDTDVSA